jgi:hypothetical protein
MKEFVLALLAIFLAGCATSPEITAWNMATEVNTPAAYQDFVHRYPESGHVDEAHERIGKAEKDRVLKASSVAECVGILKTKRDPQTAALVGDLAFKAAQKESSVEALYTFLEHFKGHRGTPEIRRRLEELDFDNARKDPSPAAMEYFLFRYPESRFADTARSFLAEKSFVQVKGWGNQYGFKAYLRKFPASPHAAEVRGWITAAAPPAGAAKSRETLAKALEASAWLKRYGCARLLSSEIRRHSGNVDDLRYNLYEVERGGDSGKLPDACSSVSLAAGAGAEESLEEALGTLAGVEELRRNLATRWKVYRERDEMAKAAIGASTRVSDDLETAELSEEVLGTGPLGGLDVGKEKGSTSARKARERFELAEKTIRKDRDDIRRLLIQTDGLYRPLQLYVTSCLAAD